MRVRRILAAVFLVSVALAGSSMHTSAQTASDLQKQVDDTNAQIQALREEIARLQTSLNETSKQKQTLQTAVTQLDLNIKQLTKSISLTQAQIKQKDLEIGSLSQSIGSTTLGIATSQDQIAYSLRQLEAHDDQPVIITLLAGQTISTFFDEAAKLETLRITLQNHVHMLGNLKVGLENNKNAAEDKRRQLAALSAQLNQQNQGLVIARTEQNKLLTQTKNQESIYQAQIAQKKALQAKFEQDLLNYEAQLNLSVNPGSIPKAGSGVLQWPVASPYITQGFGNTSFSTQNPQVYSGKGHNAIDLRATPGTPILAARSGTVRGTGNTDTTCPGASYGKWIFIDHTNGLSTLYAHLSTISVSEGQAVETGQVIGYSDTTGYATGPHLHFGVYATSGSKIASFPSKSCTGKTYTMPVADVSAYLNPLSYLPAL